jgi:hypothetical protein
VNCSVHFNRTEQLKSIQLRSSTLKNHQATLLLAVILAAPAFAVADSIPGHSRSGNNYVSFSEGLADQQDLRGSSARCNFLVSSVKGDASKTSSFAKGEKGANLGVLLGTGSGSDTHPVKVVDFGANQGASSDNQNGKDKDKGKHNGTDGNGEGNGNGVGSGTPDPVIPVAEPGSQTLVLFGLAGLGMFSYRRKSLTSAI